MRVLFVVLALFVASPLAVRAQTTASDGEPVISLVISAKPSAKLGESIFVHVLLTNVSSHDIVVPREVRGTDCGIDVRDVTGTLAPDSRFGLLHNGHTSVTDLSQVDPNDLKGKVVYVSVKAGKTWEWDLEVTKFYDITKPGKYLIFVTKLDPEDPALPFVKSNTLTLQVTP